MKFPSPSYKDRTFALYYKIPISEYMRYQLYAASIWHNDAWKFFEDPEIWKIWKEKVNQAIKITELAGADRQSDIEMVTDYFNAELKKILLGNGNKKPKVKNQSRINKKNECMTTMCTFGIITKRDFQNWLKQYHPDKCDGTSEECAKRELIFKRAFPKLKKCIKENQFCPMNKN